jgi:hypothetical protein
LYEYLPEEKNKPLVQKAADWFGERIGGEQIHPLVKAWEEALLNFIPNPRIKQAIQRVMEREEIYQEKLFQAAEQQALNTISQSEELLGA